MKLQFTDCSCTLHKKIISYLIKNTEAQLGSEKTLSYEMAENEKICEMKSETYGDQNLLLTTHTIAKQTQQSF